MKTASVLLSLAFAGSVAAQAGSLPKCAQSCANKFLAGGIGNCGTDPKCICASSGFISDIACCLAGTCNQADQASAVTYAQQLCTANGVSVPSAVSCASTATSSGTVTATATNAAVTTSNSKNTVPKQTAAPGAAVLGGLAAVAAALL